MNKSKIDLEELAKKIFVSKSIFQPNLTSQLSCETAILKIKKNFKVLDLGCGSGIIGIAIMKHFNNIEMYCSDLDKKSVKIAENNFIKQKLIADVRVGNLFDPWKGKRFDYIINDVSGISSIIAKKSAWFMNKVPCNSGKDGTDLTISVIKESPIYLTKKGLIQIPLISLSNVKKVVKIAKRIFSEINIIKSKDWFLPPGMENLLKIMNKLKLKKYINFEKKFGRIICNTSIAVCRKPRIYQ